MSMKETYMRWHETLNTYQPYLDLTKELGEKGRKNEANKITEACELIKSVADQFFSQAQSIPEPESNENERMLTTHNRKKRSK